MEPSDATHAADRSAGAEPRARLGALVEVVAVLLAFEALALLLGLLGVAPDKDAIRPGSLLLAQLVHAACATAVVTFVVRRRGSSLAELGLRRPTRPWRHAVAVGVGAGVAIKIITILLTAMFYAWGLRGGLPDVFRVRGAGDLVLFVLCGSLAGFVEELVYRGYLLTRLEPVLAAGGRPSSGLLWAAVVTSVVFGLQHAYQGGLGIAVTMCAGFLFAALVVMAGRNLVHAMIAHAVFNAISFVILFAIEEAGRR